MEEIHNMGKQRQRQARQTPTATKSDVMTSSSDTPQMQALRKVSATIDQTARPTALKFRNTEMAPFMGCNMYRAALDTLDPQLFNPQLPKKVITRQAGSSVSSSYQVIHYQLW